MPPRRSPAAPSPRAPRGPSPPSVAAAAPSLAASPVLECPDVPGWVEHENSGPSLTRSFGVVAFNFGTLTPQLNAPADATHYRFAVTAMTTRDQDGGPRTGDIVDPGSTNPRGLGRGSTLNARVEFEDFKGAWSETHRLESFTVTYRIEWIESRGFGQDVLLECDNYAADITVTSWENYHNDGTLTSFF